MPGDVRGCVDISSRYIVTQYNTATCRTMQMFDFSSTSVPRGNISCRRLHLRRHTVFLPCHCSCCCYLVVSTPFSMRADKHLPVPHSRPGNPPHRDACAVIFPIVLPPQPQNIGNPFSVLTPCPLPTTCHRSVTYHLWSDLQRRNRAKASYSRLLPPARGRRRISCRWRRWACSSGA